jgi:hypothetical protein
VHEDHLDQSSTVVQSGRDAERGPSLRPSEIFKSASSNSFKTPEADLKFQI